MGETARWLDREAAANYLSVRVDELPKLVKAGKLPRPSLHFGPRTPRWDRQQLDDTMGGANADTSRGPTADEILAKLAASPRAARRGQARHKAQAGR